MIQRNGEWRLLERSSPTALWDKGDSLTRGQVGAAWQRHGVEGAGRGVQLKI